MKSILSNRQLIAGFIVFTIMVCGVVLRLSALQQWDDYSYRQFYQEEPLLTNIDGYYYLKIAQDLAKNDYTKHDKYRSTFQKVERSKFPPLLSVITAAIHQLSNYSINWIAVVIPCFLGVIIVVPLFGIGYRIGGFVMAITSSIQGSFAVSYYIRTSLGRFDTDCLNVTFSLMACVFSLFFFKEKKWPKKTLWLICGVLNWILFLLWWDMTPIIASIIALFPFLLCCIYLIYENFKFKGAVYCSILMFFIMLILDQLLFDGGIRNHIITYYNYVSERDLGLFPNVSQIVAEQSNVDFLQVVSMASDSYPVTILGIIGLLFMFYREYKITSLLVIPIVIAFMGVFYAQRYLIFFGPIISIGFGYLLFRFWLLKDQYKIFGIAVPSIIILTTYITLNSDFYTRDFAKFPSKIIDGYKVVERNTEKNSLIWNYWDLGHPLIYWGERAALTDGWNHSGELSVYSCVPLAAKNSRLSANFIHFLVKHGKLGFDRFYSFFENEENGFLVLKRLLSLKHENAKEEVRKLRLFNDIEEGMTFLFPEQTRPVYLYLSSNHIRVAYWWYWLGSWDTVAKQGVHTKYIDFYKVSKKDYIVTNYKNIEADIKNGKVSFLGYSKSLKSSTIINKDGPQDVKMYKQDAQAHFELFSPTNFAILMRRDIKESVFNQLFMEHKKLDLFEPLKLETPVYQIYKVQNNFYKK